MRVPVTKMHGARNDFIILDQRAARLRDLGAFARWACERRGGIGADGVIALERSARADARMRTINADGSEAEMCGNGVRCAARWLDEAGEGERIAFETDAGIVETAIVSRGEEYCVRVTMGRPHVASMTLSPPADASFVELGNPHVVVFVDRVDEIDLPTMAAALQNAPGIRDGANVHVVETVDRRSIRARHWERGVGLTMACGTGAVACAAAALERKIVLSPLEVAVPGGRLLVEWDGGGSAQLTGPAVRVFDTDVEW